MPPVSQRALREHHLALALRHIATEPGPVSRADLGVATGLTRATVSGIVDELTAAGLLTEADPLPRNGAGRPAMGLALARTGPAGLGLEINVDYLAAGVLDLTGATRVLHVRHHDQRGRRPHRVLADLAKLATQATDEAASLGLVVAGTVVGVPGLVGGDGLVRSAPNLGWRDVDVVGALAERAGELGTDGAGIRVDNEANLAALAELHAQRAPEPSFVYISGEIGVGAGIVLNGRLLRGARGYSGEIGHVTIHPDGPRCRCGSHGCLETYTNLEVLLRSAGLPLSTQDGEDPLVRLTQQAQAGRAPVLAALAEAATALGIAAADVVNLVDVDTVVLGGIYARLAPWLAGPVSREIQLRTVTSAWAPVSVRAAAVSDLAAVVGGAGAVVRQLLDAPGTWLARTA